MPFVSTPRLIKMPRPTTASDFARLDVLDEFAAILREQLLVGYWK